MSRTIKTTCKDIETSIKILSKIRYPGEPAEELVLERVLTDISQAIAQLEGVKQSVSQRNYLRALDNIRGE